MFLLFPAFANADTRITVEEQYGNIVWNKEGSPYILESNIELMAGSHLTIGPGVVVMSSTSTGPHWMSELDSKGVDILGTEDEPVRFIGVTSIILGKKSLVTHAFFEGTKIGVFQGTTAVIKSSVISGSFLGISVQGARLSIFDSEISGNVIGIRSNIYIPIPKAGDGTPFRINYIGGYANASSTDPMQNIIDIHNTIFENNEKYSIYNYVNNNIIASDNWWGSPDGPKKTVYGAMITSPWLTKDPRLEPKPVKCCSSVLFLPGFQASRLSKGENQLWEPNRNDDVRKLFLNAEGKSLEPAIYTSGILESAFGLKNIYKKFVAMINGVVAEKIISEWLPFAYDWRMSVSDIVSGNTPYATTTKKLIVEVERLALGSKTGKVTIVAHSNGGLVAKMLGYELEKQGKSGLIDKVVFVAVPQLGTPQAILGMLHGAGQAIAGGTVMSGGVARAMGINMPGAYGLLPSSEYFKKIVNTVLTLAGKAVNSHSGFIDYLTGKSDKRLQPKEKDTKSPAVLSPNILAISEWMHSILDTWKFPTHIKVISIAGWGIPTTKTVEYEETSVRMKKSADGDGTVVSGSAMGYDDAYEGRQIYFNHALYQRNARKGIAHADILESDSILKFMSGLLATSSVLAEPLPAYLSYEKPKASDYPWMSWITVSVHSPVDIELYDSRGGHVGLVPSSDASSDMKILENTIAGGQYEYIGDEKYITVPANDNYSVLLKGTDTGSFTLNVQKFAGEDMVEVASSTYRNLPVTIETSGSMNISPTVINPPLEIIEDDEGVAEVIYVNPCQAI